MIHFPVVIRIPVKYGRCEDNCHALIGRHAIYHCRLHESHPEGIAVCRDIRLKFLFHFLENPNIAGFFLIFFTYSLLICGHNERAMMSRSQLVTRVQRELCTASRGQLIGRTRRRNVKNRVTVERTTTTDVREERGKSEKERRTIRGGA